MDINKLNYVCFKVLPLVYDETLSYYEVVCKVTDKLNEVIDDVNQIPELISKEVAEQIANDNELFNKLFEKIIKVICTDVDESDFTNVERFGGEIFWHNGELVECVKHMDVGTNYVAGTNIKSVSVLGLMQSIRDYISTKTEKYNERADREIQSGEYLFWKDKFLKAKQNIANDTILTDEMFEEVHIGDELKKETDARVAKDNDLQAQVNANDGDISALQQRDIELKQNIDTNNTNINNRVSNIVAQSGNDNTEIVDGRKWSNYFGELTSTTIGDAIRGQIEKAICNRGRIITNDIDTITEQGFYVLPADTVDNFPDGSKQATHELLAFNGLIQDDYLYEFLFTSQPNFDNWYCRVFNKKTKSGEWVSISNGSVNARTWSTMFGSVTSNTLGDAIRGQIEKAICNRGRIITNDIDTITEQGFYVLPADTVDNFPDGSKQATHELLAFDAFFNDYLIEFLFTSQANFDNWYCRVFNKKTKAGDWASFTNASANPLYNKKWAFCGDSFTYGDNTGSIEYGKYAGQNNSYAYLICARNNMKAQNLSVNGRSMGYSPDYTNSFTFVDAPKNYTKIDNDVDYITLYFGINDSHQSSLIPIGNIDDENNNTFCGAYNVAVKYILSNYPTAHLGIIVSNGCETDAYRTKTIEIANKYGIPYIDLNGDKDTPAMIRSSNPNISNYTKDIRLKEFRVSETNLHPNQKGHLFESYCIENFLKRL